MLSFFYSNIGTYLDVDAEHFGGKLKLSCDGPAEQTENGAEIFGAKWLDECQ